MTANFDQARVELDRTVFLRMAGAHGATVICLEGGLWVTRDGSPVDIQLLPDESYTVEGASPVIVSGFDPSLARVRQPKRTNRLTVSRWLESIFAHRGEPFEAA